MSDKTIRVPVHDTGGNVTGFVDKKLVDMGDGTHAERTAGTVTGNSITPTDKSGTITSGGTAQTLAAANTSRRGYWIQNNSTGDLWINTLATAVASQPSMKIPAGALYEAPASGVSTGAISIIGATTGQAFTAREW